MYLAALPTKQNETWGARRRGAARLNALMKDTTHTEGRASFLKVPHNGNCFEDNFADADGPASSCNQSA